MLIVTHLLGHFKHFQKNEAKIWAGLLILKKSCQSQRLNSAPATVSATDGKLQKSKFLRFSKKLSLPAQV